MSVYIANDEDLGKAYTYSSLNDRILRVRIQKSNKADFLCLMCDEVKQKDEGSVYYSGLCEGKFYTYKTCLRCHDLNKLKIENER